jgi:uncharacterized membrane protein
MTLAPWTPDSWTPDPWTLAAILGMAGVTYLCRGGGYWLFSQIRPTPFLRAMLVYVPGALFVSYVAPSLVSGGVHVWVGAAATVLLMATTGNTIAAIFGGTAAAWAVWAWM